MFVEVGLSTKSSEEHIEYLDSIGYVRICGKYPYCTWFCPDNMICESIGREVNEVGEVFIEMVDFEEIEDENMMKKYQELKRENAGED